MKEIKLNTGIMMPIVGSGTNTYGKENNDYSAPINGDTTELDSAIAAGYRHFDTAISYRNEAVVGDAIKKSGLPREEFFITSKIPGRSPHFDNDEAVRQSVKQSLEALQTDYIDLYLIHHPWDDLDHMVAVWKVLEDYVDKGVLKSIGVSNFDEKQLAHMIEHARIKPSTNQIKSHPGDWNDDLVSYSLANDVIPVAWGPISRTDNEAKAKLTEIGEKYGKNWAQVSLRYQLERGIVVIPKSHNAERQKENLNLFDFKLTQKEQAIIKGL